MIEAFEKLDPEKKEKILDAAFTEFANFGYKKAVTDHIVKKAGIGKGMLFYYFTNKETLYHYLIDYALACCAEYFQQVERLQEGDVIEYYRKVIKYKMEAYLKYPAAMEFLSRFFVLPDEMEFAGHAKEKLMRLWADGMEKRAGIFKKADVSLFRKDMPAQSIIKHLQWSMDGYHHHAMNEFRALKHTSYINPDICYEAYVKEFDVYLAELKRLYYVGAE